MGISREVAAAQGEVVSSFLRDVCSSVSSKGENDAFLPSRHMILNELIEPWCQWSIFRKTASISSVIGSEPRPVSVMGISAGVIL